MDSPRNFDVSRGLAAFLTESLWLSAAFTNVSGSWPPRGAAAKVLERLGKPEAFRKENGQAAERLAKLKGTFKAAKTLAEPKKFPKDS